MFIGLLALHAVWPAPPLADEIIRLTVMTITILWIARPVLPLSLKAPLTSAGLGVLVFAIWIAPDLLFPGYRHHLENAVTGNAASSFPVAARGHAVVLTLRTIRAAVIVPIVEELFWRAWLMRWIISVNFQKIPLGTYAPLSFWLVAVMFASEHGPYFDVGLAAGILYNWWMVRKRSLGDVMVAHAVTNLCLSVYVIAAGKWEYWM